MTTAYTVNLSKISPEMKAAIIPILNAHFKFEMDSIKNALIHYNPGAVHDEMTGWANACSDSIIADVVSTVNDDAQPVYNIEKLSQLSRDFVLDTVRAYLSQEYGEFKYSLSQIPDSDDSWRRYHYQDCMDVISRILYDCSVVRRFINGK